MRFDMSSNLMNVIYVLSLGMLKIFLSSNLVSSSQFLLCLAVKSANMTVSVYRLITLLVFTASICVTFFCIVPLSLYGVMT